MANEPNYINPKNPVYISYAWIEDNNDVLEICRVMRENGIDYRRDVDGLCPYKKSIADVEKEIGDGDAVVVIVSRKYMTSLHTMNEWHNILDKGDIARRVFVVVLEDAEISNDKKIEEYHTILKRQFDDIKTKYDNCLKEGHKPGKRLKPVEHSALDNLGFLDDLDSLYAFCHNFNRGSKIEVHRANGFKEIIVPLKKYVTELAEATNAKETIEELKAQIENLKQEGGAANNAKVKKDLAKNIEGYFEINGIIWADRNVGAKTMADYGDYYTWGKALKMEFGDEWRLPTKEEFRVLIKNCKHKWTTRNSVYGLEFRNKDGQSLFLPAAGAGGLTMFDVCERGVYWTSSPALFPIAAYHLDFDSGSVDLTTGGGLRCYRFSVRAVLCKN